LHWKQRVNIVVRPSDTLYYYAGIFRVSVKEILDVNPGIVDPDIIYPSQIVTIPADAPVPPDPGMHKAQYLVRSGDTLFFIAQQFGISLDALISANPQINNPNLIYVTQVINLPVTPPRPPDPPPRTIQIYVSAGETIFSIARRIGVKPHDIIAANPQIRDPDIIFAGQIINVPIRRHGHRDPDDRHDRYDPDDRHDRYDPDDRHDRYDPDDRRDCYDPDDRHDHQKER